MTWRELRRTTIACWALALMIGAADLGLFLWLDGPARVMLDNNDERYWPIVLMLGVLCFPLAAGIFFWAVVNVRRAQASAGWPVTTGKVIASDIEITTVRGGRMYWPRVRYTYAVLGAPYENGVIAFGLGGFGKETRAKEFTARYPVGRQVEVRHDPDDPQEACLETDDTAAWRFAAWAIGPALSPFIMAALIYLPAG
jgi:uncharacterized protein DUF3592